MPWARSPGPSGRLASPTARGSRRARWRQRVGQGHPERAKIGPGADQERPLDRPPENPMTTSVPGPTTHRYPSSEMLLAEARRRRASTTSAR